MSAKVPMTPGGHARMHEELKRLKSVDRPKNIQDIATARDHGDLSENAEFHAAKEKQGFIEGRIKDLEDKLARAEVIDPAKLTGARIAFGARVKVSVADEKGKELDAEVSYQLVGPDEADLAEGTISVTSPLGRALIGREVGDEVRVKMPAGVRVYEILDVSFGGE
ncbi:MAG: transcription elongation factor GreA [Deltaproteobacteria bacterium]|nr:transcription elongation factor GreA [Deltaproteobacteria bacterium]